MLMVAAAGGLVVFLLLVAVVWHFAHRHEGPAHETPHGEEHGRHGRH
jgi:hypothetical protein